VISNGSFTIQKIHILIIMFLLQIKLEVVPDTNKGFKMKKIYWYYNVEL